MKKGTMLSNREIVHEYHSENHEHENDHEIKLPREKWRGDKINYILSKDYNM